ncbi:MAG: carbohydrate ABC transporter permease [Victivallales bacterium]|nr:carbohydrate ABC transporter permease [Victivallales bacterium]MBT7304258.1 carbohydrate ABC transporter permease [Victivallales bacterium]
MPIIGAADRKSPKGRTIIALIYLLLIFGSLTMVFPFAIMATGSISTPFDYDRRSPLPRFLVNRGDRFLRALCGFFPPTHRGSIRQLRSFFPSLPPDWSSWSQIGDASKTTQDEITTKDENGDEHTTTEVRVGTDEWTKGVLAELKDKDTLARYRAMAMDYGEFADSCDLRETILAYDQRYVGPFLRRKYSDLAGLNEAWEISIDTFAKVSANEWSGEPIDQRTYAPLVDVRYEDLLEFRKQYRDGRYTKYLDTPGSTANFLRPAAIAYVWEEFAAKELPEFSSKKALASEDYLKLHRLPFPVPDTAPANLRAVWHRFLKKRLPLRHVSFQVTGKWRTEFAAFLQTRFRNPEYMNRVMRDEDPEWPDITEWSAVELTPEIPAGPVGKVWMDFVGTQIPIHLWKLRPALAELGFQQFVLAKHRTLSGVNRAYGLNLDCIEELRLPFREAVLVSFHDHQWAFTWDQVSANYIAVFDYLFRRGRAVMNTVILVILTILITLTVNPLAGYALSRFKLRQSEKILVFCLATMAFPAAVAAIPGFLLLRDMGLLNTFAALVLPGAANGMTIFLLKGFFDSLPQDLFEAATIDGASEWRIFLSVSLPLVKPILAVGALNSFLLAYNGWAWAIIVCQNPKIWTMAVWTYQFYQTQTGQPFTVMAAFIVNSLPVLAVFLLCQKIILRGIILPQLK